MTMEDMTEEQRIEAARIRDEAAAAAQGDRSAWAHLLDVIHAPDARVKALEEIAAKLADNWEQPLTRSTPTMCPWCLRIQTMATLSHASVCPVTLARALYPRPK